MLRRRLKEPFGTAGLLVAIVALVFALAGGAYAAKQVGATASKAGKPGPRGKTGKTGPAGPAGPTGPAGSAGAAGPKGDPGEPGAPGKNGTNGKDGKEGSPWTAGGTLPEGATETGAWGANLAPSAEEFAFTFESVSFNIPLEAGLGEAATHFVTVAAQTGHTAPAECPGTAASPEAEPGAFCVYEGAKFPLGPSDDFVVHIVGLTHTGIEPEGTGNAGANLVISHQAGSLEEGAEIVGTWAVTGAAP